MAGLFPKPVLRISVKLIVQDPLGLLLNKKLDNKYESIMYVLQTQQIIKQNRTV